MYKSNNILLKMAPKFNSSKEGVTDNMGDFKTNVTIDKDDRFSTVEVRKIPDTEETEIARIWETIYGGWAGFEM